MYIVYVVLVSMNYIRFPLLDELNVIFIMKQIYPLCNS